NDKYSIIIADSENNAIRRFNLNTSFHPPSRSASSPSVLSRGGGPLIVGRGVVDTIAGGGERMTKDGSGMRAQFNLPFTVLCDRKGLIYVGGMCIPSVALCCVVVLHRVCRPLASRVML